MQKESIKTRAIEMFRVPEDIKSGVLHIEMSANREVFVENHKGIFELGENEVVLNAGKGSVRIVGQRLCVVAMNAEEIRLSGIIESVSFGA